MEDVSQISSAAIVQRHRQAAVQYDQARSLVIRGNDPTKGVKQARPRRRHLDQNVARVQVAVDEVVLKYLRDIRADNAPLVSGLSPPTLESLPNLEFSNSNLIRPSPTRSRVSGGVIYSNIGIAISKRERKKERKITRREMRKREREWARGSSVVSLVVIDHFEDRRDSYFGEPALQNGVLVLQVIGHRRALVEGLDEHGAAGQPRVRTREGDVALAREIRRESREIGGLQSHVDLKKKKNSPETKKKTPARSRLSLRRRKTKTSSSLASSPTCVLCITKNDAEISRSP